MADFEIASLYAESIARSQPVRSIFAVAADEATEAETRNQQSEAERLRTAPDSVTINANEQNPVIVAIQETNADQRTAVSQSNNTRAVTTGTAQAADDAFSGGGNERSTPLLTDSGEIVAAQTRIETQATVDFGRPGIDPVPASRDTTDSRSTADARNTPDTRITPDTQDPRDIRDARNTQNTQGLENDVTEETRSEDIESQFPDFLVDQQNYTASQDEVRTAYSDSQFLTDSLRAALDPTRQLTLEAIEARNETAQQAREQQNLEQEAERLAARGDDPETIEDETNVGFDEFGNPLPVTLEDETGISEQDQAQVDSNFQLEDSSTVDGNLDDNRFRIPGQLIDRFA